MSSSQKPKPGFIRPISMKQTKQGDSSSFTS